MRLRRPGIVLTAVIAAALTASCAVADRTAGPGAAPSLPAPGAPPAAGAIDRQAALGLPDVAGASPEKYLLIKDQYVASYNVDRGIPNWVAWHLERTDLGPAERSDWATDVSLPAAWRITPFDYKGTGYTRGHMCPSGDRTDTPENNRATFLMTNMVPQTYDNNAGPWNDLEQYCRLLARQHNELYIASGGAGPFTRLRNPKLSAPAALWKVAVVLPEGDNDLARITASTRVIAVMIPNVDGIKGRNWEDYATTVDAIESAIGFNLLPLVPEKVQSVIESRAYKP